MNTYTCSVPLLEESTMSLGTESVAANDRSDFKLTGLNALETKKAAILLVQHKRRPQTNVHADTRSRIFGGDGAAMEPPTGRVLKPVQPRQTLSTNVKDILTGGADGTSDSVDGKKTTPTGQTNAKVACERKPAGSGQVADNGPARSVRGQHSRNPITQSGPGWTSNEPVKMVKRVDRNAHQRWDVLGTPVRVHLKPGVRNENVESERN